MRRSSSASIWTPRAYDRMARYYDAWVRLLFPSMDKAKQKVVEGMKSGSILDVACGTGTLLSMAHRNGLRCYGIDTSRGMLRQAKAKVPDVEFTKVSFYHIPYGDGCFDYVVETNAVSAVGVDARKVVSEMLRVCRRGGEIRIADYAKPYRETWWTCVVEKVGVLIGDSAHDYVGIFREFGHEAEVEILGGYDMYQYIRVRKH